MHMGIEVLPSVQCVVKKASANFFNDDDEGENVLLNFFYAA